MAPLLYRLPKGGRNSAAGFTAGAISSALALILLSMWATTQWAARELGFAPVLGPPLLAGPLPLSTAILASGLLVGALASIHLSFRTRPSLLLVLGVPALALLGALVAGPLYTPWSFFLWHFQFADAPGAAHLWEVGYWAIGVPSYAALVVAASFSVWRARQIGGQSDAHGSARYATKGEVQAAGFLGKGAGVYVGAYQDGKRTLYLRDDGPAHCLAFAPTRSGKGVGLVLPTLLSWPESVIVYDVKGENWALSSGWRKAELGQNVLKFDPTCSDGTAARYNPLLEVRSGPREVGDVQNIAEIVMDPAGTEAVAGLHWTETGADFLVALILHVLYASERKTLTECLNLISAPGTPIDLLCEHMIATLHDPDGRMGWRDAATREPTRTHPTVASGAQALLNKSENEASSVVSTVRRALRLYADPIIAANIETSDFSIHDLMHAERPTSLYLTIPPSDLRRTRPLVRIFLNQALHRLTESIDFRDGRSVPSGRHRLLLMMDEFPVLGKLPFFQEALAFLAGYGIKAYLITQSLDQLYAAYGHDEAIVANCHIRIAHTPNKLETARLLSEMAGTMTVHREVRTYTGNRIAPWLGHVTAAEQESQRPLLTTDEALRLPDDAALIFVQGLPPIYGTKIRYYEDPTFAARASLPPPALSDRIPQESIHWEQRVPEQQPKVPLACQRLEASDEEAAGELFPVHRPFDTGETDDPWG